MKRDLRDGNKRTNPQENMKLLKALGLIALMCACVQSQDLIQIDAQPPTITLSSLTQRARSNRVSATATAADNVGVVSVEFYMDGVFQVVDTDAPFTATMEIPDELRPEYRVEAKAFDAAGNRAVSNSLGFTKIPK